MGAGIAVSSQSSGRLAFWPESQYCDYVCTMHV